MLFLYFILLKYLLKLLYFFLFKYYFFIKYSKYYLPNTNEVDYTNKFQILLVIVLFFQYFFLHDFNFCFNIHFMVISSYPHFKINNSYLHSFFIILVFIRSFIILLTRQLQLLFPI